MTASPMYKRAKLSIPPSTKTIGTHSGTFQADEVRDNQMGVTRLSEKPMPN